jgi:hypothetical protein
VEDEESQIRRVALMRHLIYEYQIMCRIRCSKDSDICKEGREYTTRPVSLKPQLCGCKFRHNQVNASRNYMRLLSVVLGGCRCSRMRFLICAVQESQTRTETRRGQFVTRCTSEHCLRSCEVGGESAKRVLLFVQRIKIRMGSDSLLHFNGPTLKTAFTYLTDRL